MQSSRRVAAPQAESGEVVGAESRRAELTVEQILAWADAHHAAHGHWPVVGVLSGPVDGVPGESWKAINHALALGLRGLPGDSSLAELLAEHRGAPLPDMGPQALADKIWAWEQEHFPIKRPRIEVRGQPARPLLRVPEILAWADAHHQPTGSWPTLDSGAVLGADGENWSALDQALTRGHRGLPGRLSVSRMLKEYRGLRGERRKEPLTIEQILAWADAHRAATGEWPTCDSGPVRDAPHHLTWAAVRGALSNGGRGLPAGWTLPRLLAQYRDVRPPLSLERILAWADAHHAATGRWPADLSGSIAGVESENWETINRNLKIGGRGLPGGQSLSRLLAEHRAVRNAYSRPPLNIEQILAWADAHHAATGRWPSSETGPVDGVPGETWEAIASSLRMPGRGLAVRTTLGRLLIEHRGPEAHNRSPGLTLEQVLAWADVHHAATGRWPCISASAIIGVPGESWRKIDSALRKRQRGLPGGLTLAQLLAKHRGHRNKGALPRLTFEQILAWADAHHAVHGRWPDAFTGPVTAAPGETWSAIADAVYKGHRGISVGMSLPRLLAARRSLEQP